MSDQELLVSEIRSEISEDCSCRFCRTMSEAANEIERLRGCLAAIQKATAEGRVCDDVAWFDSITTLHDFCDLALNGPEVVVTRG